MSDGLKQAFHEAVLAVKFASEKTGVTGRYKGDPTPTAKLPTGWIWARQDGENIPRTVRNVNVRTDRSDIPVRFEPLEDGTFQIKQVDSVKGPDALGEAASDYNQPDSHGEMQIAPLPNKLLKDLRLRLSENGGLEVVLEAGIYEDTSGALVYVILQRFDLTGELPSAGMKVPVILGLLAGLLVTYSGTEMVVSLPPTSQPYFTIADFISTRNVATGADLWLWGLALRDGQTSFTNTDDFVDLRPYLSLARGGSGGTVDTVAAGTGISVDSTDPANPEVALLAATISSIGGLLLDETPVSGSPVALTVPRLGAERGVAPLDGAIQVASAHLPTPSGTLDEAARWVKSADNPILSPAVAWETTAVQEPCVIFEDGEYKMWYRGGWLTEAIGYATCPGTSDPTDPANWTKYASNPILGQGGAGVSGNAAQPTVIHVGTAYYLYYNEFLASGDMRVATSADGITGWTVNAGVVATRPSGSTSWGNHYVWRENLTWYMLGEANNGSGVWSIYLLTSTDGLAFTYLNSGNALTTLQIASGGMYGGPWMPTPQKIDGYYHLWYHAAAVSGVLPTRIYHAKSLDLLTWTVVASPALTFEGTGFEIDQVADAHVLERDGTTYLFYDGDDNGASAAHIGVASVACTLHELISGAGTAVREDVDGLVPVAKLPIAGTGAAGVVKPDGSTITIDPDGTIHASEAAIYAPVSSGDLADPLILDSDGRVIVGRIA